MTTLDSFQPSGFLEPLMWTLPWPKSECALYQKVSSQTAQSEFLVRTEASHREDRGGKRSA